MSTAFRVGAFIVGSLLALRPGVFLIGSKEFLFSTTYTLRADFQNVGGLDQRRSGASGRHSGRNRKTASSCPSARKSKVTVLMNLQHVHPEGSQEGFASPSIKSEGLLGDKYRRDFVRVGCTRAA